MDSGSTVPPNLPSRAGELWAGPLRPLRWVGVLRSPSALSRGGKGWLGSECGNRPKPGHPEGSVTGWASVSPSDSWRGWLGASHKEMGWCSLPHGAAGQPPTLPPTLFAPWVPSLASPCTQPCLGMLKLTERGPSLEPPREGTRPEATGPLGGSPFSAPSPPPSELASVGTGHAHSLVCSVHQLSPSLDTSSAYTRASRLQQSAQ